MSSHSEVLRLGLQHRNFGGDKIQPITTHFHFSHAKPAPTCPEDTGLSNTQEVTGDAENTEEEPCPLLPSLVNLGSRPPAAGNPHLSLLSVCFSGRELLSGRGLISPFPAVQTAALSPSQSPPPGVIHEREC